MAVLDDMLLNLDELDLKIAQRLLVSFAATLLCDASPWLLPLLTSIASELQKEDKQVEEVEVKGHPSPQYCPKTLPSDRKTVDHDRLP